MKNVKTKKLAVDNRKNAAGRELADKELKNVVGGVATYKAPAKKKK